MTNDLRDENTINNDANPGPNAEPASVAENCQPTTDNSSSEGPTGPRTVDGKAVSSMNALKHGLSITRHVVLKHENLHEFNSLSAEMHEIFTPQSARERLAVDEIAHCKWALRRFEKAEAFALEFPTQTHSLEQPEVPAEHKRSQRTTRRGQSAAPAAGRPAP